MQYVAGYVTKKLNNNTSEWQISKLTGRCPEFSKSSRRPGLGRDYIKLVSKLLLNHPSIQKWQDVPRSLTHGTKSWPLGAYLRNHLIADLGFKPSPGDQLNELKTQLYDMLKTAPESSNVAATLRRSLPIALKQYRRK